MAVKSDISFIVCCYFSAGLPSGCPAFVIYKLFIIECGVMKNTIWQNDGTHGVTNWNSEYRFGVVGETDDGSPLLCRFPRDVWERMKSDWFYVVFRSVDDYDPDRITRIRITTGWWDGQWGAEDAVIADDHIVRMEQDGRYTLAVNLNFGGDVILANMDAHDLLFTGEKYIMDEIYLDVPESPTPEPKPTVPETATIRDAKDSIDNGIDGVCSAIENDELKDIRPNMTKVAGAHKALDIWFNENV